MPTILEPDRRRGRIVLPELTIDPGQNTIRIDISLDVVDLASRDRIALSATIEQSIDGVQWWTLGAVSSLDLRAKTATRNRSGRTHSSLWAGWTEQVVRHDLFVDRGWEEAYELKNEDDGAWYHQLALAPRIRLTVDSFVVDGRGEKMDHATVGYGLSVDVMRGVKPATPIGRRSASLVGIFAAAEGNGALTTGSRTTIAGTLITGTAGVWSGTGDKNIPVVTDSKSNTYTEPTNGEVNFSSGAGSDASVAISYNMAGTRGTTHTVSLADIDIQSLGAQEWDGIAAGPTVVAATNTGSGQPVSASVTVASASLVLLVFGYDGASTTYAPDGSTSAQECDENNDTQTNACYYNVAQTGSPSIAATLAASRTWGAIACAFAETAAVVRPIPFMDNSQLRTPSRPVAYH